MKLMTLPPESQRLRRIARAHAAGEFSRSEYRQARRVLLEELVSAGGSVLEDTFRRTADTARRDQLQTLEVAFAGVGAPAARRSRLEWLVGGIGVVLAAMWALPYMLG